jgi:signal transduction histidine kinase/DNA-binding NarL/FixJ family response regulator
MTAELKILLLEDSSSDAILIQHALQHELQGCSFEIATGKEQFMQALRNFVPDIILSDNSLPDISASEAIDLSRAALPGIPFIMVSGTGISNAEELMRNKGANDFILKDNLQHLPRAISAVIGENGTLSREKNQTKVQQVGTDNYRILVDRITDSFIAMDSNFCYTYANSQTSTLLHRTTESMIGKNIWEEYPDLIGTPTHTAFTKAMKEQVHQHCMGYFTLLDLWYECDVYPSAEGISIFTRDITVAKKSELALLEMQKAITEQKIQEQKKLTRAMIRAQENERNRIGRELHDNINQLLVASKLMLSKKKNDPSSDVGQSLELVTKAIEEIRVLSGKYVTPLKNINLQELVRALLFRVGEDGKTETLFTYNMAPFNPDDDLKLNIYRIIQEQINNITKYASATRVTVSIEAMQHETRIIIADDGKGFDPNQKRKGIGFMNMYNRIEVYDGTFIIDSAPGKGCRILIFIPYQ